MGTVGAIGLRIAMGSVALFLIRIPYLRVVAGLLLLVVAIRLTLQRDDEETKLEPLPHIAEVAGVSAAGNRSAFTRGF
jgi:predicted tellurium resistance membrane protein TerC